MNFEEGNTISILNIDFPIVYFLLKENTVVYVGQSKIGVSRPFLHRDKNFDRVEIMSVPKEKLDEFESYYIKKYAPIYNQKLVGSCDIGISSAKLKIREQFDANDFTIIHLRKLIKLLKIKPYEFNGFTYINKNDFQSIINFINVKLDGLRPMDWKHQLNKLMNL